MTGLQPYGDPVQVTVGFDRVLDQQSPTLGLLLQPHIAHLDARWYSPAFSEYYTSPPASTFGTVPMSTAGNWPGVAPHTAQQEYHLSSFGPDLAEKLLDWGTAQLWKETQSNGGFETALNSFVLALGDTPLARARAKTAELVPRSLVRSVGGMISWFRIWHASVIHIHRLGPDSRGIVLPQTPQPLPAIVLWELKSQAVAAICPCQATALSELDGLLLSGIRGMEVSVWACLWQMIIICRKLIAEYAEMNHLACEAGRFHLAATVKTIEKLHRFLLVKFAAYFDSSSPICQKCEQPSTSELLAGDTRLQRAWDEIMRHRKRFCKSVFLFVIFPLLPPFYPLALWFYPHLHCPKLLPRD